MTRIKLCGMMRPEDIEAANGLMPEYIGFVFAEKSRRCVSPDRARALRHLLVPGIRAVGVFVREDPKRVAQLLKDSIIDIAQLHGGEDEDYLRRLRDLTDRPLLQAFRANAPAELDRALRSTADGILLDSGAGGTGEVFDWALLKDFGRPYFLAGGLGPENAAHAVETLHPFGVDVSSGIERNGVKDAARMKAFVEAVRAASGKDE